MVDMFSVVVITIVIMSFVGFVTLAIQRNMDRKWYDVNCDCSCGKCACHRPLGECK